MIFESKAIKPNTCINKLQHKLTKCDIMSILITYIIDKKQSYFQL